VITVILVSAYVVLHVLTYLMFRYYFRHECGEWTVGIRLFVLIVCTLSPAATLVAANCARKHVRWRKFIPRISIDWNAPAKW
jgi:hypothetical protein